MIEREREREREREGARPSRMTVSRSDLSLWNPAFAAGDGAAQVPNPPFGGECSSPRFSSCATAKGRRMSAGGNGLDRLHADEGLGARERERE